MEENLKASDKFSWKINHQGPDSEMICKMTLKCKKNDIIITKNVIYYL